ncbi:MAG TPA: hypothetical protein VGR71_11875 [Nitrospira sp.]|nr:hypothetical protein [Nitrospira sp.]
MLIEQFVANLASTTVISGGMGTPASGEIETLTVREANEIFPVVRLGVSQFHFKDRDPEYGEEIFACIATDGNNWTVIRGAENTRPVAHARKFTIRQVITSEFLRSLGGGSTTELVNAVTVCGADSTGETLSGVAISRALDSGPVYLPSGIYRIQTPINMLSGQVMLSFGNAVIRPTSDFTGDSALELVDGNGAIRLENVSLDGSELGAGTDIYGVFAETRRVEAELRNVRISAFPNSGIIASGNGWMVDRVTCMRNHGSGFELNINESLLFGCRAVGNARYGFTGAYQNQLISCLARDNKLGDYC